jgi:hypothetical protein
MSTGWLDFINIGFRANRAATATAHAQLRIRVYVICAAATARRSTLGRTTTKAISQENAQHKQWHTYGRYDNVEHVCYLLVHVVCKSFSIFKNQNIK